MSVLLDRPLFAGDDEIVDDEIVDDEMADDEMVDDEMVNAARTSEGMRAMTAE